MAKISELTADTSIDGTEVLPVSQSGTTRKITVQQIADFVTASLTSQFAAKQATLVSGTNIKTVNSTSLLGSGNIAISAGGAGGIESFTPSIPFDISNKIMNVDIGSYGPVTFTINTTNQVAGGGRLVRVVSDGTNVPDISAFQLTDNSGEHSADDNIAHHYLFIYNGSEHTVTIQQLGAAAAANTAPTATNVEISGTAQEGETLTGSYDYSDADSDAEGASTYQWYRADNGSGLNKAAISGATDETYDVTTDDVGKFLQFGVTPVAATGEATGTEALSAYTTAVLAEGANAAPTANTVAITGTATEGEELTGTYVYADAESDPEGVSTFKWYRADNTSGLNRAAISGATGETYELQAADIGKRIQFGVTPVASTGTATGTEALSSYTAAIAAANVAPVASSVAFTGTEEEGETLTGTYTYSDADSDAEGTSLKKWYRSDNTSGLNRAAISGATASTYILQAADVGKYIQFAVTPVAATGVTPGTEVFSAYSGAIAAPSGPAYVTWRNLSDLATANNGVERTTGAGTVADAVGLTVETFAVGESVEWTMPDPAPDMKLYAGFSNNAGAFSGLGPGTYMGNIGESRVISTLSGGSPGSSTSNLWAPGVKIKLTRNVGDTEIFLANVATSWAFVSIGTAPAISGTAYFGVAMDVIGAAIEDVIKS